MQSHLPLLFAGRTLTSCSSRFRRSDCSGADRHGRTLPLWRTAFLTLLLGCIPLAGQAANAGKRFAPDALTGLACSSSSITGAGSDACTVTVSSAPEFRGLSVTLSSSNSAVSVPGSVTVQRGATTASFTAEVTAVSGSSTVTLTATANGVSKTFALQPGATTPAITLQSTSLAFGNVSLGTAATQSLVLTSSGTAPLTVNAASVTGSGFKGAGTGLPVTLNPKQTVTLAVQFDPTVAGSATGSVVISSNASNSPKATVSMSGTGESGSDYQVNLAWGAPANSSDAVAGYNIYRATSGGTYQRLNASANSSTSYTDSQVQAGTTYSYKVTSVDAKGNESTPSNIYSATIP